MHRLTRIIVISAALVLASCRVEKPADQAASNVKVSAVATAAKVTTLATSVTALDSTVAVTLKGATEVADNFDTALGLKAADEVPSPEPDPVGAFRFVCGPGQLLKDDPLVYPGQPGVAHLHQFFGNTGTNASSTYTSLRTTGGTSCGDSAAPVQRSAYWIPAMLDGMGNAVKPDHMLTYYKTLPSSHPACGAPDATHLGYCIGMPNGLRFIFGYNMTTMTGGPTDANSPDYWAFAFECVDQNGQALGGRFRTIAAVVAEGKCPLDTGYLRIGAIIPHCWDGKNLDSPDHRSHMAYATEGGTPELGRACPLTHPYMITEIAGSFFFKIDAAFLAGKWRLSSDEMHPDLAAGTTMHMDYWEAWSPTVKTKWQTGCIDLHLSCSNGVLGNGQQIKGMVAPSGGWPSHQIIPLTSIQSAPPSPAPTPAPAPTTTTCPDGSVIPATQTCPVSTPIPAARSRPGRKK